MNDHEDQLVIEVIHAPLSVQRRQLQTWGYGDIGLLLLTSACDGQCFFCASVDVTDPPPKKITPKTKILDWIDCELPPKILLGGTEPMSHSLFHFALELLGVQNKCQIELSTSGVRITSLSVAQRLYAKGVRRICVPIYATEPAVHDDIVGVAGHLYRVKSGIEHARKAGLEVSVHSLALKRNLNSLPELAQWVVENTTEPLVIGPLRAKASLFSFKEEGVPFAQLEKYLVDVPIQLSGFPLCAGPGLPRGGPNIIQLYFQCQARTFVPAVCSDCTKRQNCMGIVPSQLHHFGANEVTPFS